MKETPLTFSSQKKQLVGIAHYPKSENGFAVIMCHGFTGNKLEDKCLFVEAARAFSNAGFWTFRFDFFGSGDSAGDFKETRLSINIQNLKDTLHFVRNEGFEKIFILGISMGAATAILTLDSEEVEGLVLWSTVPDMKKLFEVKLGIPLESAPDFKSYEYEGWLIDREFYLDALRYNISDEFKKLKMPKLIVQGSKDGSVFTEGYEYFKKIALEPVGFHLIENAGHTFQTVKHRKDVIRVTVEWLEKQRKS